MDDVEYAKLNHKKRRGKPQQTKPYLEDPTTIVYADIRTSHVKLPVEDPKPDVTENTARRLKCRNITKILILIILILSCALAFLIYKQIVEQSNCYSHCTQNITNSSHCNDTVVCLADIKEQLCVEKKKTAGCTLCPNGWLGHRENCYYFSSGGDVRTWNESREVCEEMGADLLVIEDQEQQEFINRSIKQQTYEMFWVGLYRDGDGWRWVDGRLYNTGLFQILGNSSGDCVWWEADSGYYNDHCLSKHNRICQKRSLKI
ncbi:killer cell lectin-like receptor subfamily B member 1B allele B [Aquarana catesbeiana]|uniref:killer cell lectin-like receptor subfamily B member 1B allele B n=1 Tax=Aquarana catesbeiana TaxID=8400 RepID=UPI003CCA60E5